MFSLIPFNSFFPFHFVFYSISRYMRDRCDLESDWDTTLKAANISEKLTNETFQSFLNEIDARGWSKTKFMFGDMKRRSNWSHLAISSLPNVT